MEERASKTLDSLSVTTIRSVRQTVAGLSGGQRQSVAVAKAVMWNSRVVILDEPTAALGVEQTRQVLDLVERLGDQGLAVILISHNLYDIFEVADNITVLRLGQNVAEFNRREHDPADRRRGHHRREALAGPGPTRRHRYERRRSHRRAARAADDRGHGPDGLRPPLVVGRQAGGARLAADHPRPDHHRDRLPDAELELPHRRQLRQPDRPVGALRDPRHGHRLGPAARRDRPVDRLRLRRRRRADRGPAQPGREHPADVRRDPPRARRGCGDRHLARRPVREGRHTVVRRHPGRPAGLERRRAADHRRQGHGDPAGLLHRRAGQQLPVERRLVGGRDRLDRDLRGHPAQRDPCAAQAQPAARAAPDRRAAHRRSSPSC